MRSTQFLIDCMVRTEGLLWSPFSVAIYLACDGVELQGLVVLVEAPRAGLVPLHRLVVPSQQAVS